MLQIKIETENLGDIQHNKTKQIKETISPILEVHIHSKCHRKIRKITYIYYIYNIYYVYVLMTYCSIYYIGKLPCGVLALSKLAL